MKNLTSNTELMFCGDRQQQIQHETFWIQKIVLYHCQIKVKKNQIYVLAELVNFISREINILMLVKYGMFYGERLQVQHETFWIQKIILYHCNTHDTS